MRGLPLRHAVALGLLHGPTELLPVSSSGHTTLVPWLAGWPYGKLDPELRKSFEVALHAGAAAALLVRPPWGARRSRPPAIAVRPQGIVATLGFIAPAVIPPAIAGYALGGQIERRLGTPTTIATGLLAGSAVMLAADRHARGRPGDDRPAASAGPLDGLALGVAQALALMPGVSRNGATLAAARARGFSRRGSDSLSWGVGLPVIAGATLLKGTRLAREGAASGLRRPLVVGTSSAFVSTLASTTVLGHERRARLLPASAAYRGALAALVIRRMRDNTSQHAPPIPKK
ncbi:MAG TPA: undecaprenyl-diphosphate phosphatase [Solirubrobacteraceae bacterium]|nr:undecaprenyl-diphosphate phosphatase [Solirubrobacteraceae bacterium]